MKLSPHVQLVTKQDRDWSVAQNTTESEPIYPTHREAGTLRCPPQTYSSRSIILSLRPSPSVFLYVISVAQVVHGAESH